MSRASGLRAVGRACWGTLRDNPVTLCVAGAVAFMSLWRMLTEWVFVMFGMALFGLFLRRAEVWRLARGRLPVAWWVASLAFVGVSALATVLSQGSTRQLHPTWFLLFVPLLTFALSTEPQARVWLVRAAALACLVMLVQAVLQVFVQQPPLARARGVWNAATSFGITAAILTVACALGLAQMRRFIQRDTQPDPYPHTDPHSLTWTVRVCQAGLGAGLLTVALSGSRGAALGLGAALLVIAWRMVWPGLQRRQRRVALVLALGLGVVLAVSLAPAVMRGMHDAAAYFTQGKLGTSEGERLSAWRSIGSLMGSSPSAPWIGLGHGHLDEALRAGFGGAGARHFVMYMPHMHNDWIDVLVMRGIPALALFIAMQWAALVWLARRERELGTAASGTLALAVGYGLMASFDAPYAWEGAPLALLCVCGLLAAPLSRPGMPDGPAPAACATGSTAPAAHSPPRPAA